MKSIKYIVTCALLVAALPSIAVAADHPTEDELIKIIQSDAPAKDKAIPCKQLAIYGSEKAVPALAALLTDKELVSWARIALEAIPGEKVNEALRAALGKVKGRGLIGVINSLGVRRDAKAVGDLAGLLKNTDAGVACAAAAALGRIATPDAVKALEPSLKAKDADVRSTTAEAMVICAQKALAGGQAGEAVRICEVARKADVPRQRIIEATRMLVLAKGDDGAAMLADLLKSTDRHMFGLGMRLARELPGSKATDVVVAEFSAAKANRRVLLLLALADRKDPKAMPVVLEAAKSGPAALRVVAINIIQKRGDVSGVPVLLNAVVDDNEDVAKAARLTLARLPGEGVNKAIVSSLNGAKGKLLAVLVDLAGQRQIPEVLPLMVKFAGGSDAAARAAALTAIAGMGTEKQIPDMVALVAKASDDTSRAAAEKALTALCGRAGASSMKHLEPLARSGKVELRIVVLHALAAAGGEEAVKAVIEATNFTDKTVADEAVRVLSTWPNKWPNDAVAATALAELAKSGKTSAHRVLALRGYLQYLQSASKLPAPQRVAKAAEALKMAQRPDEKRLVVAVLSAISSNGAMAMLAELTGDASVAQEACVAIVNLGTNRRTRGRFNKAVLKKALQAAVAHTRSDGVKKHANQAIKGL